MRADSILPLLGLVLTACGADVPDPELPWEASHDFPVRAEADDAEPTVITVTWTTEAAGPSWVEFLAEDTLVETPRLDDGALEHRVRLLGIPSETEVAFRAVTVLSGTELSATGSAWTGTFPAGVPVFHVRDLDTALTVDDRFLIGTVFGDHAGVFAIDRRGRLLWSHADPPRTNPTKLEFVQGSNDLLSFLQPVFPDAPGASLRRFSLATGAWESTEIFGAHHAFAQLPAGSIAYLVADIRDWVDEDGKTVRVAGDAIRILTPEGDDRELFTTWDWAEPTESTWWDANDYWNAANWTHANALWYDPGSGTLLLSLRNLGSVLEIDAGTGEVARIFGSGGWDVDPHSTRIRFQHDVRWTTEGTLLMTTTPDQETIAVEYEVDEDARSLVEVWSYGEGLGLHSSNHGSVVPLDNGNRLVSWGTENHVREVTARGEVAWDVLAGETSGVITTILFDDWYTPSQPPTGPDDAPDPRQ